MHRPLILLTLGRSSSRLVRINHFIDVRIFSFRGYCSVSVCMVCVCVGLSVQYLPTSVKYVWWFSPEIWKCKQYVYIFVFLIFLLYSSSFSIFFIFFVEGGVVVFLVFIKRLVILCAIPISCSLNWTTRTKILHQNNLLFYSGCFVCLYPLLSFLHFQACPLPFTIHSRINQNDFLISKTM